MQLSHNLCEHNVEPVEQSQQNRIAKSSNSFFTLFLLLFFPTLLLFILFCLFCYRHVPLPILTSADPLARHGHEHLPSFSNVKASNTIRDNLLKKLGTVLNSNIQVEPFEEREYLEACPVSLTYISASTRVLPASNRRVDFLSPIRFYSREKIDRFSDSTVTFKFHFRSFTRCVGNNFLYFI